MRSSSGSKTENHSPPSRALVCTKSVTEVESVVGCRRDVRCWPSDGSGGTAVTDPAAPWPGSPLGWLEHHVPSVVSDLHGFQHGDGFSQLLNQIENWNSPPGSGSTPTGNTPDQPWSQPNFPVSGFDAGWQSHMIQTLASFEDSKGGPAQTSPIQPTSQGPDGFFAGATPNHG
jgi:hypothetical protein